MFTVPYASVAQLMTKGEVDWDFAAGTLDDDGDDDSPWVLTTNGNYGLSDIFTLYGGIQSMEEEYGWDAGSCYEYSSWRHRSRCYPFSRVT